MVINGAFAWFTSVFVKSKKRIRKAIFSPVTSTITLKDRLNRRSFSIHTRFLHVYSFIPLRIPIARSDSLGYKCE